MAFRSIRNPIARAVLLIVVFWWVTLTFVELNNHGFHQDMVADFKRTLVYWVVGLIAGIAYIAHEIWSFRRRQEKGLEKGNVRGLYSTLGPPPMLAPTPKRARQLPEELPYPPEVARGFIQQWTERYGQSHPQHRALMDALLLIFAYEPDLPATHIAGGHGGRSLFMHSLLVCGLCLRVGETWKYEGLKGKSGRTVVPLRDPSYTFQADDPMVALVGLAHDIGKIECYVRDKTGAVIGCRAEHDQVGAIMLARMDETWALPDDDRRLLLATTGYYHRPMDLPFVDGGLPCDDRTIALMELLIKADTIASRLENGQTEDESKQCDAEQPEDEKEKLWTGFKELMLQSGRVNGPSATFRLGQKNDNEEGKALVYLHEASLRTALAKHLGISEGHQLGDKTYPLTRSLLKVLEEKGVLYQQHHDASFSDSRAIFQVEFYNKKKEKLATWPATIIILPGTVLPALSNLPDFTSFPRIGRALFGNQSARNKSKSLLEAAEEAAAMGDPDALMEMAPAPAKPPKKGRTPAPAVAPTAAPVTAAAEASATHAASASASDDGDVPPDYELVPYEAPPPDEDEYDETELLSDDTGTAEEEDAPASADGETGESLEGAETDPVPVPPPLTAPVRTVPPAPGTIPKTPPGAPGRSMEVSAAANSLVAAAATIRAQAASGLLRNSRLPDGRLVVRIDDVVASNSKWINIAADVAAAGPTCPIEVVHKNGRAFLVIR